MVTDSNERTWTTKDKRELRVCDMTTEHLVNTMKMLKKNAEYLVEMGDGIFGLCGDCNDEMYADTFDEWQEAVSDIYWVMQRELEKRNEQTQSP